MSIPKIYHPFITGPNNDYINKLTADNPNVRINVPPLPVMKDEISVAGETEGVQAAKTKIMDLFKDIVSLKFVRVSILAAIFLIFLFSPRPV